MTTESTPHDELFVLIVDDQQATAQMVSRLFSRNGYESECVYNGRDALDIVKKRVPDLILLDIMMPGMNGFEVLEHLRDYKKTADTPIIFITARDDASDVEQGLQLGADDYVVKPVRPRELLARAKSKLESHELRQALRQRTTDLEALLRLSEELNAKLQIDELLDLVLYLVVDLLPAETALICRVDENGNLTDARVNVRGQETFEPDDVPKGFINYFYDVRRSWRWSAEDESPLLEYPSGIGVGLWHGDELEGILTIMHQQPYTEDQQRLFEGIGRQVSQALRNAELYQIKANYAEDLEKQVAERTEELRAAQELLFRSEKLASVGRLAAGIAHEINNPLMPIIINLELLLEDIQAGVDIQIEDIEGTLKSAKRIRRIVERLLQFTRRRSDNTPSMEALNVASIIQDVNRLSKTYIRKSGISIDVDLPPDIYIYGNRDQLEQVFLNLVLNAKAAMSEGGVLTVSADVEGERVILRFEDTGHGIPDNMIDKIFEPFVSTKEDGSGLGLFVSYSILENHNGAIDVESTEGKGTTFYLTLPLVPESELASNR